MVKNRFVIHLLVVVCRVLILIIALFLPLSLSPEDYQELSEKEQEDLEKLLKEEEEKTGGQSGIQNIEAFTENLSQQLSNLDEANIHTLMDSETQIHTLMKSIENTMLEIGVCYYIWNAF